MYPLRSSSLTANFWVQPLSTVTPRSFYQVNRECVADFANMFDIHFELMFRDSMQKVCPSGI